MKVDTNVQTREIERVVKETVEDTTVVLELTETEAAILCAVVGRMTGYEAGAAHNPRRDFTDALYGALAEAGYGETNGTYKNYRAALGSGRYKFSGI